MKAAWPLLALLALSACDDPSPTPRSQQAAASDARQATALKEVEDRLRARLRAEGPLNLRAVQVHRQALGDTLAICGQINPSGRSDDPYIPYVAVVGFEGDRVARTELQLAASNQEATRVYLELVDRCFDGGGPSTARPGARPLPPLPTGLPRPSPEEGGVAQPQIGRMPVGQPTPELPLPVPASRSAASTVTTTARHPVNVRAHPSGGGAVVRIVPRGSTLQVFAEAPGGWLQVGEGEPWGWLHSSMLEGG